MSNELKELVKTFDDGMGENWIEPESLEEKRKLYKCKKYFPLNDIPLWTDSSKKLKLKKVTPKYKPNTKINSKISIFQGDISTLEIDAIVNAASPGLLGGGGIDGCINSGAGRFLRKECESLGGCKPGNTKITKGYRLPAKYVLHSVGPLNKEKEVMKSCYTTCLELVESNNIKSVAFCCIGTGAYGFPLPEATQIACETIREWIEKNEDKIDRIIFCVYSNKELDEYTKTIPIYFPLE